MAEHPDLTLYKLIHRGMRTDMARLASTVAARTEAERASRMPSVVRWYDGFLTEFELHHSAEDEIFFPALAERVPVFADRLARLEAEHHSLEAALLAVGEAIGALADPEVGWSSVRADAPDALVVADRELTLHLDHEDADVLPLFVRHMSVLEYEEISERALKRNKVSQLLFSVPWVVRHATDEERARMLREAPLPLKLMWYMTRRRHARLTQRALGELAGVPVATAA